MYILDIPMITDNLKSTKEKNLQKFLKTISDEKIIPLSMLIDYDSIISASKNELLRPVVEAYRKWKFHQRERIKGNKKIIKKELNFEEFNSFWRKPCYYCGQPIKTIGLDRINSNKSYTIDNVVPCCWTCNRAKSDKLYVEFIWWLDKLVKYRNSLEH